ncbi:GGDEF domain-containing protein [Marinomonas mediterranea]|jgi:diguanylate cyclase (GGDEF) domain|uniref:diguanylate cyclase n=1 Tax=Marinomonas mediterranea (strain ATCC 700492 / JCM 21426 / NBRC 103028 / MMB-1) TaxID=717774 RepID=F2JWB5_MARM1|nr:GGDEF domain-containing protein [Marinomonas mediterranea]ADZ89503.1 diguanylate cyclase [Marinomonas mediterranea MMB-1]WCN07601.1 diguanylate cyclase [Marinomonas mediterranea]WCN15750.1 diguanylate cyclase [Marinomonas mediterranea MMB-1]
MGYSPIQYESFVSATYRILVGCIAACMMIILFYVIYPPTYSAYLISGCYALFILICISLYAYLAPRSHIIFIAPALKTVFLTTFLPLNWYFVVGAWMGKWRLVDAFPPITAFIIVTSIVVLTLLHSRNVFWAVGISWMLQAIPVLSYLVFHVDELLSLRGLELLATYGPTSLFIFVIIPHQKGIYFKYKTLTNRINKARRDADRDILTDLLNRRGLERWLQSMPMDTSIAVILADIDHFQRLNDTKGYDAGDRTLVELASRLRTVYQGEHRLARWGGEEFLIILVNPEEEKREQNADAFRLALDDMPYKEDLEHKVTLSLGVSSIDKAARFQCLLKQAEESMLFAKRHGRNQTKFYRPSDAE